MFTSKSHLKCAVGLLPAFALLTVAPFAATAAPLPGDVAINTQIYNDLGSYRDSVAISSTDGYVSLDAVRLSNAEIKEVSRIASHVAGVHNVKVHIEMLSDEFPS